MVNVASARRGRPPAAGVRLLAAAERVFYAEGVHAVSVDRIVTEAGVTRATFYHHYRSKEELVVAYLTARDQRVRARAAALLDESVDPRAALRVLAEGITEEMCVPGFRGCAFINAAAEYPDRAHAVSRAITEHRRWVRTVLTELFARAGHADPPRAAGVVIMLRDGAMVGGYLEDAETVRAHFTDAVLALVDG